MDQMQLVSSLARSKEEAVIELRKNGALLGRIVFDASDLQSVIHNLSKIRENMTDIVPLDLDPGSRVYGVNGPQWRLNVGEDKEASVILRHPGFGWIGFKFPPNDATHLAKHILRGKPLKP